MSVFEGFVAVGVFSGGVGTDFGHSPLILGEGETDDGRDAVVLTVGAELGIEPWFWSSILGQEELLDCGTTCSRFLFLMMLEPLF